MAVPQCAIEVLSRASIGSNGSAPLAEMPESYAMGDELEGCSMTTQTSGTYATEEARKRNLDFLENVTQELVAGQPAD